LNAIYFPNSDGSHHVNAVVTQNDNEIAMLAGTYHEEDGQGLINAEATLENLPLSLANAFLPKGTVSLKGATSGILSVSGPTSNPLFTGTLATQSMHVLAEDYSVDLTIPDDTLHITGSHLDFDRIEAYAAGNSPLTLDGSVDFSDLERIKLSVDINAKNYKLIDAPQSHTALTYGKVYVDMSARAWGTLDNLKVRGQLTVLGNTDVTYVLRDSPITVKDQLSDIVTFCDFSDTTHVQPIQKRGQSVDALIVLSVEQAAQVHCMLSENGSDYVDLQGGGELTLTYDLENDMRLYGRYTIEQGMMRYSIMAIPLNDFKIQSGSYVEFTGNVSNPTLGISASERVKASVTENDVPRNVAFDVGLALSKTLEDMGLAFTLDAPEDMTVQNELSAMSVEERGRVAVTMLVTGMYMTDDFNFKSGFSYANTLNAYLQSAINNIAGQALSTVDLSFGIENSTTASGGTTTDYSFSFRKRFWGNRISLVLGGKVSSGSEAENNGQTIIDNV
ncbi:MAG: translocation/assembly module TamB domain-containing protein, partial [Bacteroidaceae bacterium]